MTGLTSGSFGSELPFEQQMQQQQSGFLGGLLGGLGGSSGFIPQQHQPLPPHPLSLENIKSDIWPEYKKCPAVSLSFFDKLRNEIDEWLKL